MTEKQRQKLIEIGQREIAKQDNKNKKNSAKYRPGMFSAGSVLGEGASSLASNIALGLTGVPVDAYATGGLLGYATKNADPEDVKDYSALSLIPGFGGYRGVKRTQLVDQHYSKGKRRNSADASEKFGGLTSSLALAALGALGGGALGFALRDKVDASPHFRGLSPLGGAGIGALAGLSVGGLSNAGGLLTGLFNAKSQKEHTDYLNDDQLVAKNLLIPGYAGYQRGRRLRSMLSGTI